MLLCLGCVLLCVVVRLVLASRRCISFRLVFLSLGFVSFFFFCYSRSFVPHDLVLCSSFLFSCAVHAVSALRVLRSQLPPREASPGAVRVERTHRPLPVLVPEGFLRPGGKGHARRSQGHRAGGSYSSLQLLSVAFAARVYFFFFLMRHRCWYVGVRVEGRKEGGKEERNCIYYYKCGCEIVHGAFLSARYESRRYTAALLWLMLPLYCFFLRGFSPPPRMVEPGLGCDRSLNGGI